MPVLHPVRLGTVRVMAAGRRGGKADTPSRGDGQMILGADLVTQTPSPPHGHAATLPVLDQRARGTRFIELSVRSVLNTPASTHMGFWSINPYVGCEFGCTYCYARDTHRWVVERAVGRKGGGGVGG